MTPLPPEIGFVALSSATPIVDDDGLGAVTSCPDRRSAARLAAPAPSKLSALRAAATVWMPYATAAGAALGLGLLGWLVMRTGPAVLARHLMLLGPIFPLVLALSGTRYLLQASAWRLAMPHSSRPGFGLAARAILASEAVGYISWAGPVAREPVKLLFVRGILPMSSAFAASLLERSVYAIVSLATIVLGVGLVATRGQQAWVAASAAGTVALLGLGARTLGREPPRTQGAAAGATIGGRAAEFLHHRRGAILGMAALSVLQVVISLTESYVVLDWLGARPSLVLVAAFEGITKLANGAGSFIPGGIGVTEAAGAFAGKALHLGMAYGVSLALARRARALVWAGLGLVMLSRHAVSADRTPAGASAGADSATESDTINA